MKGFKNMLVFLVATFLVPIFIFSLGISAQTIDEKSKKDTSIEKTGTLEEEIPTEEEIKEKAKGEKKGEALPKSLLQTVQDKFKDILFTR